MRTSCVIFLLLWSTCSVVAQDMGSLTGKVEDETGEALFGTNVVIKGPAIEGIRGVITNDQGIYRIDRLPPGIYEITISYIGYETMVASGVEIRAGESITRDFKLTAVALIGQQVVVSASRKQEKALDAPASIATVDASEVRDRGVLSPTEHVKALPGVDFSKTGISQSNTVVRGFNNVFSGALLTLVDNRIARVPSLRVNAFDMIPLTGDDIERIEVVLGPGSALYGPNSANGVMHIITRSPFESEGNTISISGGERSVRKVSLRHASSLNNNKFGIKISGGHLSAHDWEYVDPLEMESRGFNPRDYNAKKTTGDLRLDFRPREDLAIIGSAGYTKSSGIELTGLGAGQAKGWTYIFYQGRLLYRGWFAQVFYNTSNAGQTKLLIPDDPIVDNSHLMVLQLQHNASLGEKQHFAYGADVLRTRPKTQGTINGIHEDNDNIDEYGAYLQSETSLSDQIDLVLAGRIDKHSHVEDPFFSPRAALVIKPSPLNILRLTYNRAFSTPSTTNLFLDRVGVPDAFGLGALQSVLGFSPAIDVRAQGTAETGFTFRRDDNGLPMLRTSFAPIAGLSKDHYFSLHDPQGTNLMWGVARSVILNILLAELEPLATELFVSRLGLPQDQAAAVAAQLVGDFPKVIPEQLPGLQNAAGTLNTATRSFDPVPDLANAVTDIKKIRSSITETFEVGYKSVINNKLILAADVYLSKKRNFSSPLRIVTPNVFLAPGPLSEALTNAITENLKDPANASLAIAIGLLDQLNQPELGLVGNGNGTGIDELTQLFVSNAAMIPFGTISAEQASDPTAVMVAYRNFGRITLYGADLSFAYYPNEMWTFTGNYSYVSKDWFPNLDNIGDIALNAPRHKFNIGVDCQLPNTPLKISGKLSYRGGFPMQSGVYVGDVDAYTILDLNAAYQLPISHDSFKITWNVEASNVLNQEYRSFIGAPFIGRLVLTGLNIRF